MQTTYRGACFIARHEACVLVAYPDGFRADGSIKYSKGYGDNDPTIKAGDTTTPEAAWQRFLENLRSREIILNRWLDTDLASHEFDGVSSAYYQAGTRVRAVTDLIDAGDRPEAMALLLTLNRKKDPKTKEHGKLPPRIATSWGSG